MKVCFRRPMSKIRYVGGRKTRGMGGDADAGQKNKIGSSRVEVSCLWRGAYLNIP